MLLRGIFWLFWTVIKQDAGLHHPIEGLGFFLLQTMIDNRIDFRLIFISLEYRSEPFNREGDMAEYQDPIFSCEEVGFAFSTTRIPFTGGYR